MAQKKRDLILHPVRLRLTTELAGRRMTSGQLAAAMPDVAQATLYRHIKRLLEGGIFEVVDEQVVNGATERTYAIVARQERLTEADLAGLTAEQHTENFTIFAASLIDAFSRYAEKAEPNTMSTDGLSYNRATIYLDSAERADFQEAVVALLQGVMNNQPTPNRQRYTLASVVIPDERKSNEEM